ncbi:MAG: 7-carboxy-7-deazaguanine synthase [Pseudomonadota bacterium]
MTYSVKEMYLTLQGEGQMVGQVAVFCRFSGCNLWSGREEDRAGAVCNFCDTDFVGTNGPDGGKFADADALSNAIIDCWKHGTQNAPAPHVVFTGGEPLLQLDTGLISALKAEGVFIAIETNGTIAAPENIDWVCVSPKANAPLVQNSGDELKLVYPQPEAMPERFRALAFRHFSLQPMDGPMAAANTKAALAYCQKHPEWRLSIQTHKMIGID